jgi:hypothetical protein
LLICPACGFKPEPKCTVVNREGELVELRDRATINAKAQARDKVRFYQELRGYAATRGYKSGWTAHKFKEKHGHWPRGLGHLAPLDPSPTTLSWIRSRNIAWARARAS